MHQTLLPYIFNVAALIGVISLAMEAYQGFQSWAVTISHGNVSKCEMSTTRAELGPTAPLPSSALYTPLSAPAGGGAQLSTAQLSCSAFSPSVET